MDGAELTDLTVLAHARGRLPEIDRQTVMHTDRVATATPAARRQRRNQPGPALPSPVRIGLSRVVPELKMFYRRPEQMVLTFSLPAVICILLGSIFSTKLPNTETSTGAVIAASMLAYGILSTSFINLGISIAGDRDTGALRRLRGTPTTALSYFSERSLSSQSSALPRPSSCWPWGYCSSTYACRQRLSDGSR